MSHTPLGVGCDRRTHTPSEADVSAERNPSPGLLGLWSGCLRSREFPPQRRPRGLCRGAWPARSGLGRTPPLSENSDPPTPHHLTLYREDRLDPCRGFCQDESVTYTQSHETVTYSYRSSQMIVTTSLGVSSSPDAFCKASGCWAHAVSSFIVRPSSPVCVPFRVNPDTFPRRAPPLARNPAVAST